MQQRKGSRSRVLLYPEDAGSPGADPAAPVGYVLPLNAATPGVAPTQARIDAPYWNGLRVPYSSILGLKTASGSYPLGMEFKTLGVILKMMSGKSVAPVANFGGTGKYLHYFQMAGNDPLSFQMQHEYLDGASPVYMRSRGVSGGGMRFGFTAQGPVVYTMDCMGRGDQVFTDLGGTKTEYGYAAKSYFNGMLSKNGSKLATVSAFDFNLSNTLSRTEVAFNDGIAGDVVAGPAQLTGNLALLFESPGDLGAFYDDAYNDTILTFDCVWADKPLPICTELFWLRLGLSKVSRGAINVGGPAGLTLSQQFRVEYDPTTDGVCAMPAFALSNLGPWTIPASAVLGVKVEGAATVTKTLTAGSNKGPKDIVTDLSASGGITGATAAVFPDTPIGIGAGQGGHFIITSNKKGTAGSIQIDTTVTDSAHALLGLAGTTFTGKAPDFAHMFLLGGVSTQY